MKAKYIRKEYGTGFERNKVYLIYEYRGENYIVVEDRAKGNEPLAWQHRSEQDRIDKMLDMNKNDLDKKPIDFDKMFEEIWEMNGWND